MRFVFSDINNNYSSDIVVFPVYGDTFPKIFQNYDLILDAIRTLNFKGNFGEIAVVNVVNEDFKIAVFVGMKIEEDDKSDLFLKNPSKLDFIKMEEMGVKIVRQINGMKLKNIDLYLDDDVFSNTNMQIAEAASRIAMGMMLYNYRFDEYFSKKNDKYLKTVNLKVSEFVSTKSLFEKQEIIINGVLKTRNLVTEPANVIYPESFKDEALKLQEYGLNVKVLTKEEMKSLNMGALLGVAQGSDNDPYLVILEWKGDRSSDDFPIAFVGKGVTFDTGGVNVKPDNAMRSMKYDMGGAAVVFGLMQSLAERKAKVNVIGCLALVENAISGKAQRPGDVVKTMSGQTVEIDHTDAEGRLILSDAMWYVQEEYSPNTIVDLATLTGAIVVALGNTYAGLFANDDELAKKIIDCGQKTGELVWRMPLHHTYDSQIKSDIADMKNTGANRGREGAGASTAAHFLQRFIKNTKEKPVSWAHIDIAGVCWEQGGGGFCAPKGATGYGVRLLNQLLVDYYE